MTTMQSLNYLRQEIEKERDTFSLETIENAQVLY